MALTVRSVSSNANLQLINQPAGDPGIRVLQVPKSGKVQAAVLSTLGMAHYRLDVFSSEFDPSPIVKQYYLAQQNAARAAIAQSATIVPLARPPVKPFSAWEWATLGVGTLLLAMVLWLGWSFSAAWRKQLMRSLFQRRASRPAAAAPPQRRAAPAAPARTDPGSP
jgi:hypothetical protein